MNSQPLSKTEDKSANKNKSKNRQSPGEAEIQTPSSGIAQSPVSKGSMIATNLMGLLDNASTADMHSSPVQKSPPRGFIKEQTNPKQRLIEKICMENHPAE